MQEQNYQNHVRKDPLYHYIGTLLVLVTVIGAIVLAVTERSWMSLLTVVSVVALSISFLLIRLYALKLQDRVIRMEEQFRYYRLTGKPLNAKLTLKQITALRFASDEEFAALCDKAVSANMTPDAIKKAIGHWRPDHHRV